MRVASYNLLHGIDLAQRGAVDLAAAAAVIGEIDADVVALQEVDRAQPRSGCVDQVVVLADMLGYDGIFAAALRGSPDTAWTPVVGGLSDHRDDGPAYGVGILSRLPLEGATRTRLPGGGAGQRRAGASLRNPGWDREPRIMLTATVWVERRPLVVGVTHLSYLPWRAVRQLRTAMDSATLGGSSRSDRPAALVGDLNLPSRVVRTAARGWRHAGGAPTFPSWRPRLQMHHVLLRGAVAVQAVGAHHRSSSDHLPLVVDLSLPG